ncbi:MAG: tRNA pseudouridine(13) synthase TruD [Candidatus Thorarchaeota archaeon]
MRVLEYDNLIGMEVFTTQSPGIGGRLKKAPKDFIVQEIGVDGSIAPLEALDQEFSDQPGKFTMFFLVKRNLDSIQAIRRLSKTIGVSYKRFSYAGIKDRRAITSQRVTFRGSPHDLIGREISQLTILHPHRVPNPVVPGVLEGNQFIIMVREVTLDANEVKHRLNNVQQEIRDTGGILNFYGPQRFGIMRPNTHLVGKQIVLGNFEQAIQILLQDNDSVEKEKDSGLLNDSVQGSFERAIRHYLNKHPGKFKESLGVLPKDLVRLYIHAYQSYLFNRAISERAQRGIILQAPVVGDYTMPATGQIHDVRPVTKDNVKRVQQEVQEGRLTPVIPIIGYDFEKVPLDGAIGDIYRRILKSEKITPRHFRLNELPIFSSRGTFRSMLVNPRGLKVTVEEEKQDTPVRVEFALPKGSYASVVLRELMKPDSPMQL